MDTLLLTMDDVEACLTMERVIDAVADAYRAYQRGLLSQPPIVSVEAPAHNGETDVKACYDASRELTTVKVASGYYNNEHTQGLPNGIATVLLLDGRTGRVLCVMDGSLITGIRTGAAGALSSRLLARPESHTLAILGSGEQARMQAKAHACLFALNQIRVWARNANAAERCTADIAASTGIAATVAASPAEALAGADIAVSTTPSTAPLTSADQVAPGTHVVAVGADAAGKNEWDPQLFARARVVVDSLAQCLARGETRNAVEAGVITPKQVHAEIGEVLLGTKPGRQSADEITIFDTTGMGAQDTATAALVYTRAVALGLGTMFAFM